MPDRVDTPVHGMQTAAGYAAINRASAQADLQELGTAYDSVLMLGELGDLTIVGITWVGNVPNAGATWVGHVPGARATWATSTIYMDVNVALDVNVARVGYAREVEGWKLTRWPPDAP
jgi:hypothetical protein